MKLSELFEQKAGLSSSSVDISAIRTDDFNIPYIRPSSNYYNLVAGYVSESRLEGTRVFPPDTIFVSTDGQGSHSYAYVSPVKFVPNSNVSVLIPKIEMELREKYFYVMLITSNRFRFSYGRKPKGTRLMDISVPPENEIPNWVYDVNVEAIDLDVSDPVQQSTIPLRSITWAWFKYECLFEIKKGKRLTKANMVGGKTPFVGSIDKNNGYREYISAKPNHKGHTITINYNGSVGEVFYQPRPFWASDDVNVLYPKFSLNKYIAFFLITLMRKEQFRFNYGRKWETDRMKISLIRLPITEDGKPAWQYMEDYIKSLPYSSNL